jgi:hypothetical protein
MDSGEAGWLRRCPSTARFSQDLSATAAASMSTAAPAAARRPATAAARSRNMRYAWPCRCCVGCSGARCRVGSRCAAVIHSAAAANGTASIAAIGNAARSAMIVSAAFAPKAVRTPSVAIAPAAPGSHSEEDAVVEVAGAVVTHGRAGVRRVAVIPIGTSGLNPNTDRDLSFGCRCQDQACKQCRRAEECFESAHNRSP